MEQFTYAPNSKNRDREPGRAGEGATACEEGEETLAQKQKNGQEQDLNQLRKVRREKFAELQQNGKDPFVITKYDQTHHSQEIKENFDALEGKQVSIAGRMMSKRVM